MKRQLSGMAGVLGVALAAQALVPLAAGAQEYPPVADQSANSFLSATVLETTGTFLLSSAGTPTGETPDLEWQGLLAPPDPDADDKMAQGHMREGLSLAHMLLGGATLGLLAGAGLSGIMLVQQNDPNVRLAHQVCVGAGTAAYFADGALMLFAPRPHRSKGETHFSNIVAHRYLFYLHLAGMTSAVLTGLIATRLWQVDTPDWAIRRTHPAIGSVAIGAIAVSATVMALNF